MSALAVDSDGFIQSISVDVGTAISFVKATGATDSVSFVILLSDDLAIGDYPIKVTAVDDEGLSISKEFTVKVKEDDSVPFYIEF